MMASRKAQNAATNPPIKLESRTADVAAMSVEYGTAWITKTRDRRPDARSPHRSRSARRLDPESRAAPYRRSRVFGRIPENRPGYEGAWQIRTRTRDWGRDGRDNHPGH